MRRLTILNNWLVQVGIVIGLGFFILFTIIVSIRFYLPKETDCIQLLIENKEQQAVLQEQINNLNIRIKETDKTIIEHWKDMRLVLKRMKEASTPNE